MEDHAPLHGSLEVNDRYSTQTSRLRAVASVSYANLFQREHSLSLQVQATPEELKESFLVSASYLAPMPGTGASLVVYGVHSDSDVAAVSGIDVMGKGDIIGLRAVLPLPGGGQSFTHSVLAGLDYKNFKEDLILGADTAATPIDYVPLTVEYSMSSLAWAGTTEVRTRPDLGHARPGFHQRRVRPQALTKRAPTSSYLRADLTRTQNLPKDFLRDPVGVSAQLADQPLISNEGFSIGGLDSVRGYAESQALGDSGVRASMQLETPFARAEGQRLVQRISPVRLLRLGPGAHRRTRSPMSTASSPSASRSPAPASASQPRLFHKMNAMLPARRAAARARKTSTSTSATATARSSACGPNSEFSRTDPDRKQNHEEVDGAHAPGPDDRAERGVGLVER